MIKITKLQKVEDPNQIGDILYGADYVQIESFDNIKNLIDSWYILPLSLLRGNSWRALKLLGIEDMSGAFKYNCPYVEGNVYYWFVPLYLLYNNADVYKDVLKHEYFRDSNWHKKYIIGWIDEEPTSDREGLLITKVERSMLGHGFTDSTLPNDGDGELNFATMRLSNDDLILGKVWVWYNK